MPTIAFKTLGCRLNQFETDALVSQFSDTGYTVVDFKEKADVVVVNTCTVTNQSDHKSRNIVSQARRKNSDATVVITGCVVNNKHHNFPEDEKVLLVDNTLKNSIFSIVDSHLKGEHIQPTLKKDVFGFDSVSKSLHTRTSVKVQDGCNNFCTYCIIPFVRGRAQSRPVEDIVQNIKTVVGYGFKEVVLTGVNISRYNYKETGFADLVKKILEIDLDFRLRISSIEPDHISEELIDLFTHDKFMPHLHLCLQSGSDSILQLMRRMYSVDIFTEITDKIRDKIPFFNFTTDILVGFPGESDKEFQQTCDAIHKLKFSHIHTFKYSVRKGTKAERMPNHIPEHIKAQRSEIVRGLSEKYRIEYFKQLLGIQQKVLVEKVENEIARGYGELYVPIRFRANNMKKNDICDVKVVGYENPGSPYLVGA